MSVILSIRPSPGDVATLARAREMGVPVISRPMFRVEPVAWTLPDAAKFDAVLLGSANIFRHAAHRLSALTPLPAWCVGEATASAARRAGFCVAHVGRGGLQPVAETVVAAGATNLLRLSGEAHVPLTLPSNVRVEDRIVYRVANMPIMQDTALRLDRGSVVLLHSAGAAHHFAAEIDCVLQSRRNIALACLGPRIADAAGTGWRDVQIAPQVDDTALLALSQNMWQAFG